MTVYVLASALQSVAKQCDQVYSPHLILNVYWQQ